MVLVHYVETLYYLIISYSWLAKLKYDYSEEGHGK